MRSFARGGTVVDLYLAGDHFMWAHGDVGEQEALFFVDTGLVTIGSRGQQLAVEAEQYLLQGKSDPAEFKDSIPGTNGRRNDRSALGVGDRRVFRYNMELSRQRGFKAVSVSSRKGPTPGIRGGRGYGARDL